MKSQTIKRFFSLFKPSRSEKFSKIEKKHLDFFNSILSKNHIISRSLDNDSDLQNYNEDWLRIYKGNTPLVLKPSTVPEIQKILAYCNDNQIAVVPQGGNTGLVGGSVPVHDEIVLSFSNLNRILKFDKQTRVLTCESGCILQSLNDFLKEYNCEVPLDLGASGSCHIGGNISTNAGGKYLIKYGPLRGTKFNFTAK
jgi:FAD/FMN-containing dehydrogenase